MDIISNCNFAKKHALNMHTLVTDDNKTYQNSKNKKGIIFFLIPMIDRGTDDVLADPDVIGLKNEFEVEIKNRSGV